MEYTEEIDTASPVASWADEVESAEAAERSEGFLLPPHHRRHRVGYQ